MISSHHSQHSQNIKALLVYLAQLSTCLHAEAQNSIQEVRQSLMHTQLQLNA